MHGCFVNVTGMFRAAVIMSIKYRSSTSWLIRE